MASGDVDVDGTDDLLILETGSLNVVRYNAGGDRYISHTIQGTGARGPLTAGDFNEDGLAELAVIADASQVNFRMGATTDEDDWTIETATWRNYDLGELGPLSLIHI